jgi:hypothetical protein
MPSVPSAAQQAAMNAAANSTPATAEKPWYMTISGAVSIAAAVLILGGIGATVSQHKARRQAAQ